MKLGLGTVQLGLNYGISNKIGKPNEQEALKILEYSIKSGIDCFDTAAAYGNSEELIGLFLKKNNLQGKIKISTKIQSIDKENPKLALDTDFRDIVKSYVDESLRHLGIERLDYGMLHAAGDLFEYGNNIVKCFSSLVENGKIKKFGVSVYTPNDVERCLLYDEIKVIQIPFNLLDSRLIDNGLLKKLKEKNIEVHARSVYLQGLLLMDANDIPKNLHSAVPLIVDIDKLCKEMQVSKKQLAFCYVRDNPFIDKFFIGCESLQQIQEITELNTLPKLSVEDINNIANKFRNIDEKIINPSLW